MADTIFTSQSPATDDLDFITHHLGMQFTVSSNGNVTGGRAWVPAAGRPPTFFWQLWRVSDSALLAECNLNGAGFGTPTAGTWMSLTSADFTTPGDIAIVTTESYVVNIFSDDGHFVFTDNGTETFPIGTGIVSASTGRFNTGGLQADFPNSTLVAYFFADVAVSGAIVNGSATLTAQSSLTATALVNALASASLSAQSSLTAHAGDVLPGTLTASGSPLSTLTAVGTSPTLTASGSSAVLTASGSP